MKKIERIALYREAFLKGKSEEECRKFDEKDIDKQYGSIMAWKRRSDAATTHKKEEASVNAIISLLKRVKLDIPSLKTLSEEDRGRITDAINAAMEEVVNFDRNKKAILLKKLESEREEINKQGETLNRQIEELRQQLS
ncbi:MAG: hypothetical protein HDR88_15730 [Bacteroides sp.]|nr:hypothetical protein [Bacteroides sp.]